MSHDSPPALKRRRLTTFDPMDSDSAMEKFAAAKQKFGRDIRVFETATSSSQSNNPSDNVEEPDDFFEFTAEDYYRIMATKKEDKYLKTRKIREAEEANRRSKISKAVIRVRFPDNHTLEATFHPSEPMQSLIDLLMKAVSRPDLPFYIYTTPPKKQIRDMSQDFYSAGFIPGAIVYFSYDLPNGDDGVAISGPFLDEEVMSLKGLEIIAEQKEPEQPVIEPAVAAAAPSPVQERKPADKKMVKPKWLKM